MEFVSKFWVLISEFGKLFVLPIKNEFVWEFCTLFVLSIKSEFISEFCKLFVLSVINEFVTELYKKFVVSIKIEFVSKFFKLFVVSTKIEFVIKLSIFVLLKCSDKSKLSKLEFWVHFVININDFSWEEYIIEKEFKELQPVGL